MARLSVLVVDDDFLVRLNTAAILEDAGFEVIEACDAASALALLRETSGIHLVCTDVQMPGELDGIDLVWRMRAEHPKTKVIIISGHANSFARAPDTPCLRKPFNPDHLVGLARQELGVPVAQHVAG